MKSQTDMKELDSFQIQKNGALFQAIVENDLGLAIKLLSSGAHPSAIGALAEASSYSDKYNMVLLLLSFGSNPNLQSEGYLETPLHFATSHACKKNIELLLDFGAKPHLLNKNGNSPFSVARTRGKEVLEIFLNSNNTNKTFIKNKKTVIFILQQEASRWFISYCERSLINRVIAECNKTDSINSLLSTINSKMLDVREESQFYNALVVCSLYLQKIISLNKEEKDSLAKTAIQSTSKPEVIVTPTAPPEEIVMPHSTSPSGESEPGSPEEQIEGQSSLGALSFLASKQSVKPVIVENPKDRVELYKMK